MRCKQAQADDTVDFDASFLVSFSCLKRRWTVSSMSITSRVFKLKRLLLSFGEPSQLYINQYNYNPT